MVLPFAEGRRGKEQGGRGEEGGREGAQIIPVTDGSQQGIADGAKSSSKTKPSSCFGFRKLVRKEVPGMFYILNLFVYSAKRRLFPSPTVKLFVVPVQAS